MNNQDAHALVESVISLSSKFTKAIIQNNDNPQDNILVSPINALMCLAMAARGANGQTQEEMARALFACTPKELDLHISDLAKFNSSLLNAGANSPTVLKGANGLWLNATHVLDVNEEYRRAVETDFDFAIESAPFDDALTLKINQWANDNTDGMIPAITKKLPVDSYMFLASALYFNGPWLHPFNESLTKDRKFTTDDGAAYEIPVMDQELKSLEYQEGSDYHAIRLPYQAAREAADYTDIVLVLPKKDDVSARDWLAKQGASPNWLRSKGFRDVEGHIRVPRMDITKETNLIAPLRSMGINDAFDRHTANFNRMRAPDEPESTRQFPVYVGNVAQQAVFQVDEVRTRGAAVTSTSVRYGYCPSPPKPRLTFFLDRSFAMAVCHSSGVPLFIGAVNTPVPNMGPQVN